MSIKFVILSGWHFLVNMEIRQYTEFSEIPLDVTDWDRLVDGSRTGSVFLSYYWIKTWWNVFGYQYKLRFLLALENDQVIGFAPLMQDHRGCIRFIGDTNSDYLDFVVPSQKKVILGGFLKLLHECRNDWSSIELKNILCRPQCPVDRPYLRYRLRCHSTETSPYRRWIHRHINRRGPNPKSRSLGLSIWSQLPWPSYTLG